MIRTRKTTKESMEAIVSYLYSCCGVEVYFEDHADNAYYPGLGRIEINSSRPLREQYHTLLHEFAHVLLYPNTAEIDAWNRAEVIPKIMNLTYVSNSFYNLKDTCLREYKTKKRNKI